MFHVYVLFSKSHKKIYIGFTSDLEGRLQAHNHPSNKGWTKNFQPWIIVYSESYPIKSEVLVREKQLKSFKGREFIRNDILKGQW